MPVISAPGTSRNARMCSRDMYPAPTMATLQVNAAHPSNRAYEVGRREAIQRASDRRIAHFYVVAHTLVGHLPPLPNELSDIRPRAQSLAAHILRTEVVRVVIDDDEAVLPGDDQ